MKLKNRKSVLKGCNQSKEELNNSEKRMQLLRAKDKIQAKEILHKQV